MMMSKGAMKKKDASMLVCSRCVAASAARRGPVVAVFELEISMYYSKIMYLYMIRYKYDNNSLGSEQNRYELLCKICY
ncbi:hypothetical protein P3S67_008199 [Capsicum chacoense]